MFDSLSEYVPKLRAMGKVRNRVGQEAEGFLDANGMRNLEAEGFQCGSS